MNKNIWKKWKLIHSKMVLGDPTTYVYQFIFDENDSNDTNITQYFIMHGLGSWIKLNIFVAHMLYLWSFSHNKVVPIDIKHNIYGLYLNT